jgi:sulfite exporter TauE/SafE
LGFKEKSEMRERYSPIGRAVSYVVFGAIIGAITAGVLGFVVVTGALVGGIAGLFLAILSLLWDARRASGEVAPATEPATESTTDEGQEQQSEE